MTRSAPSQPKVEPASTVNAAAGNKSASPGRISKYGPAQLNPAHSSTTIKA